LKKATQKYFFSGSLFIVSKIQYAFLFYLLINYVNVFSQVQQKWYVQFNNPEYYSYDAGNIILNDSIRNIYVAGVSGANAIIIKYDSIGNQKWIQTYGFNLTIDAFGIDKDRNLYLACHWWDAALVKFNCNGEFQWQRIQTGYAESKYHSLAIDSENDIYVTGEVLTDNNYRDYLTVKYNTNGDSLWSRRFNYEENSDDRAYSLILDDSQNVYITGMSCGDKLTLKYNYFGVIQWIAKNSNGKDNYPQSIQRDSKGNIIISGYQSRGGSGYDFFTLKYNKYGGIIWERLYRGSEDSLSDNRVKAIKIDANDNIFVTGFSSGENLLSDYCTIKYDSSGNQIWVQRYDGPGHKADYVNDIKLDFNGNVYITGSISNNAYSNEFCTIKYDNNGNFLWEKKFTQNDTMYFSASSLALDINLNIYVTGVGHVDNGQHNFDIFTVKYSQYPTYIVSNNEFINDYKLEQNYPNPFNPKTNIRFKIKDSKFIIVKVYNLLGKEVETLVNEKQAAGTNEVSFDGSNYSSGIYFYSLFVDGIRIDTKRMILLK
jgi:hypothetical protein